MIGCEEGLGPRGARPIDGEIPVVAVVRGDARNCF